MDRREKAIMTTSQHQDDQKPNTSDDDLVVWVPEGFALHDYTLVRSPGESDASYAERKALIDRLFAAVRPTANVILIRYRSGRFRRSGDEVCDDGRR